MSSVNELTLKQAIENLQVDYKLAQRSFEQFAHHSKELIQQLINQVDAKQDSAEKEPA